MPVEAMANKNQPSRSNCLLSRICSLVFAFPVIGKRDHVRRNVAETFVDKRGWKEKVRSREFRELVDKATQDQFSNQIQELANQPGTQQG